MAAAIIIGTAACSKIDIDSIEEQPVNSCEPETYTMSVVACKSGDGATKALALEGKTLNAAWTVGERVMVYNVTKSADLGGCLEAQTAGANTTLKGTLTGTIENGDELKLKFLSPDYALQDGTLTGTATSIDKTCDYAEATVTVISASGSVTTTDASFTNQQAIVKFTLKNSSGSAISASALSVQVDGIPYTVVPASAASELYVAVPGFSNKKVELFAKVGTDWYSYDKSGISFTNGHYYTVGVKMAKTDILPGKFSVSGGTQVRFSKGNLKYKYSGSYAWSFHANQYDRVYTSSCEVMGEEYMDLFTWGNIDYPRGYWSYYLNGSSNLSGDTDWGSRMGSGWRTLSGNTSGEWYYLFHTRSASTVGGTAKARFAKAYLFGSIHGIILFPDNYVHPAGLATPTGINASGNTSWNANQYSSTDWAKMEAAGAVFLPAAGRRDGVNIYIVDEHGWYWSSTAGDSEHAYFVCFYNNDLTAYTPYHRSGGNSVRLVRNAN